DECCEGKRAGSREAVFCQAVLSFECIIEDDFIN
ncbi:hypothetical protein MNBD_GAMMA18-1378, partial [hydrothermal vent metagenome]